MKQIDDENNGNVWKGAQNPPSRFLLGMSLFATTFGHFDLTMTKDFEFNDFFYTVLANKTYLLYLSICKI